MSRPLVIKVTSHKLQPRDKPTGSIKVELIKASDPNVENHEETSSGLVRNLINKYESRPALPKLAKRRTKSMFDLRELPNKVETHGHQKSQDDFLHRKNYGDEEALEEWRANFKQALSRFQQKDERAESPKKNQEVYNVREKAQQLLEASKHDYFWFNEVMGLLQQIVQEYQEPEKVSAEDDESTTNNLDEEYNHINGHDTSSLEDDSSKTNQVLPTVNDDETNPLTINEDDDKHDEIADESEEELQAPNGLNVNKMKQMYEEKVSPKQNHFTEAEKPKKLAKVKTDQIKVPLKYFGQQNNPLTSDTEDAQNTIDHGHLDSTAEPSWEDDEQPPSISSAEAIQMVNEMMKEIENCDRQIDSISIDNHMEANRLNEILIQVLIKLDDLQSHSDGDVITMKKNAFAYTQECIQRLKQKVYGEDIF